MYGNYLIMERRKKLMGDEFYCVSVVHNLLEALLDANRLNANRIDNASVYYVRKIKSSDIDDASRRALQQERAVIDYYASGTISDSAEEIVERFERGNRR
jgi:hypothetical protein